MVKPVKWLNTALSLYFVFFSLAAKAQPEPLNSIETDEDIVSFSVDRTGNIFLGLTSGTIKKLSGNLDSLVVYNPTRVGAFTLLEAWHGFQVFAFNQKFQDFVLLDRFLTQENRYDLGATGLFYIAILGAIVGELIGRYLLFRTGFPL